MMVKPDANSDGTLEGLVREMLRPMLREWMDANLPGLVEDMVAREIAKIMNQQP
jgi:cell pole-organizing protein PopZ